MNKLPESWAVQCPDDYETNTAWREVVEYLNKKYCTRHIGKGFYIYEVHNGRLYCYTSLKFSHVSPLLTLDEVLSCINQQEAPEWTPKFGEVIDVSDNGIKWYPRICSGFDPIRQNPYSTVDPLFEDEFKKDVNCGVYRSYWCQYARPHLEELTPTPEQLQKAREFLAKYGFEKPNVQQRLM